MVTILAALCFLNFVILIFMAAFIVRLRGFVSEVVSLILQEMPSTEELVPNENIDVKPIKPKTWDQKFEEELDMIQRRIREERGDSGLVNLE